MSGPSDSEVMSHITSKTPISPKEGNGGPGDATQNYRIIPKNWEKFLNDQKFSANIEDRRTPEDMKFISLKDRWEEVTKIPVIETMKPDYKGPKPLTAEEFQWMENYYLLMQVHNRQDLDNINEERGLIRKPGDRYYKKQPKPHPRD